MTGAIHVSVANVIHDSNRDGKAQCIQIPLRPCVSALWALAEKDESVDVFNHCAGCRSPIGTVTKTIKFDPKLGEHGGFTAPTIAAQGVSCDVCHTI